MLWHMEKKKLPDIERAQKSQPGSQDQQVIAEEAIELEDGAVKKLIRV